jgi:light-regulated signal transduction histidine kinase (bacteriophytochrome)
MSNIKNPDASFCGKVPLHQTNSIQPHGVLLVVKKEDLTILQCSENAGDVFQLPFTELVNQPVTSFLTEEDRVKLSGVITGSPTGKLPFHFRVKDKRFLAIIDPYPLYFVFEIEREPLTENESSSFTSIYQQVKLSIAAIESCATTGETCTTIAKEVKKLSGFDKVMVYRFDEEWNGDVIAEEAEQGMESYLGLKFPASDIPKQARELYKKSPYRLIPTNRYEPVRLYPVINPLTNAFTDLSNSNLRSVAAVHLEYLHNMKVNASMSTRILKDGELWGLIACHHRTPKYLSYEMRTIFELLSNVISAKISAVQNGDSFQFKSAKQELQRRLVESVVANGGMGAERLTLMQFLDADGVAIITNYRVETAGITPEQHEIEDLVFWLQANDIHSLYHQPALPAAYDAAESFAQKGSGLLALPVDLYNGDLILAFRSEVVRKIDWGGNPAEAIQFESDGKRYHPRASFRIWQQKVRQTARPWNKETLEVAEGLLNFLVESKQNGKHN